MDTTLYGNILCNPMRRGTISVSLTGCKAALVTSPLVHLGLILCNRPQLRSCACSCMVPSRCLGARQICLWFYMCCLLVAMSLKWYHDLANLVWCLLWFSLLPDSNLSVIGPRFLVRLTRRICKLWELIRLQVAWPAGSSGIMFSGM
jgi:hypothetical protein